MNYKKLFSIAAFVIIGVFAFNSCKTIKDIQNTLTNIKDLKFKLQSINNFKLAGINLSDKTTIKSFSITDGVKLTQAFANKRLPAEFILNIEAKNPNDGTGSTKPTTLMLESLKWTLYIDNVRTIDGDITNRIEIPGKGGTTIIPIFMNLDLYDYFSNRGYDGIVKLALALGGVKGNTSSIRLDAVPIIKTPLGLMEMGEVTIVDHKFSS